MNERIKDKNEQQKKNFFLLKIKKKDNIKSYAKFSKKFDENFKNLIKID